MVCPQDDKCPWFMTPSGDDQHDTDECGRVMSTTGRCRSCCRTCKGTDYPLPTDAELVEDRTQSTQIQRRGAPLPHDPGNYDDLPIPARIVLVATLIIVAAILLL